MPRVGASAAGERRQVGMYGAQGAPFWLAWETPTTWIEAVRGRVDTGRDRFGPRPTRAIVAPPAVCPAVETAGHAPGAKKERGPAALPGTT